MAKKVVRLQSLGEDICSHVLGAHVRDRDDTQLLLLARIMIGEVDVLGRRALDRIVGHGDAPLAVAE